MGADSKWLAVFTILFSAFATVVILDYFAPQSQLCKNTLPFEASWEISMPESTIKYYLSEDERFFNVKFSSRTNVYGQFDYLEKFDKDSNTSRVHYVSKGGCIYDDLNASKPYFDPFAVSSCFDTRRSLIKTVPFTDEGVFEPPQKCSLRKKDAAANPIFGVGNP